MRNFTGLIFTILLLGILTGIVLVCNQSAPNKTSPEVEIQTKFIPETPPIGFDRASGPKPLAFPADFGAHSDFQTEWWYYTGNLSTESGRHFGYQLTFFRRALLPPSTRSKRQSDWATDQIYLAHFALTDVSANRFSAFERFARGAAGLSGAVSLPYQVWLDDWSVEEIDQDIYRLQASQDGLRLNLRLNDLKGSILQGDRGYSQKGPHPGNASYYISQTRLATEGEIQIGKEVYPVSGLSWMDHEFSTSALSESQVGWDWFGLQFSDGSELMIFTIRKEDGTIDPYSSGTLIEKDGTTRNLSRKDFSVSVMDTWQSPVSKATYPSRWIIEVPSKRIWVEIKPYLAGQELNLTYTYWEGAVKIDGKQNGERLIGNGYVELTGYAGSFAGDF